MIVVRMNNLAVEGYFWTCSKTGYGQLRLNRRTVTVTFECSWPYIVVLKRTISVVSRGKYTHVRANDNSLEYG